VKHIKAPWGDEPIFDWDAQNEEHISHHNVTVFDVEECFENSHEIRTHRDAQSNPQKFNTRYAVIGQNDFGRRLVIIVKHKGANVIRPITAFDYRP
jgi:uncharacterized DUF497 family protein